MADVRHGKPIMLVVEDRELALSVKVRLDGDGFEAEVFTDPILALESYGRDPLSYSLVIMDMKMVRMSTFEFMREIKKGDANSKILLITPFEVRSNEFSKVLPASKVDGFLERPLISSRLVSSVREILDMPGGNMAE